MQCGASELWCAVGWQRRQSTLGLSFLLCMYEKVWRLTELFKEHLRRPVSHVNTCSYCCLVAKSCLTLLRPWTITCQAPLSMGFPRQAYWGGLPFPSLGDLPDPGIKPVHPALAGRFFTAKPPGKLMYSYTWNQKVCTLMSSLFCPMFCLWDSFIFWIFWIHILNAIGVQLLSFFLSNLLYEHKTTLFILLLMGLDGSLFLGFYE